MLHLIWLVCSPNAHQRDATWNLNQTNLLIVAAIVLTISCSPAVILTLMTHHQHSNHRRLRLSTLLMALTIMLCGCHVDASRFLREGFSNQMESEARSEVKLEDNEAMAGMTREMYLMQDLEWELKPPLADLANVARPLRNHIHKFLHAPVILKLEKRRGKLGLRAIGRTEDKKKLRAYWRQGVTPRYASKEFLNVSYDEAVRSRLNMVEFEVQLPPLKRGEPLPSVVYSVAVESGTMNPNAIVPRGAGLVYVKYKDEKIAAGNAIVSLSMGQRNGIVDPSWAKGHRPFFRPGRSVGVV